MEKEKLKKTQILDAAMRCMARYGVVKATMDDIAHELGMKKASLYYYYKNKEAIFIDALEREILTIHEYINDSFKDGSTISEKLTLFISGFIDNLKKNSEILGLNINAMIDNHSIILKLHKQLKAKNCDYLSNLIQEGIDSGEFRKNDANKIAQFLRTMFDAHRMEVFRSISTVHLTDKDFLRMKQESLFMLDIILNGLKTRN